MKTAPQTFQPLIDQLSHMEEGAIEPERVAQTLRDAEISLDEIRPLLRFEPDRYTRHQVYRSKTFEVIALCWPPNVSTPIHNHDDQKGWIRVLDGALLETRYSTDDCPANLDETTIWTPKVHSKK
ncbi:MAG: cysteine dioxygenase family protein, partial [Planctomycetes bacterium]|nr:cysteine dioxygenase family protein [Planctomycetota bacterium]